MIDTPAVVAQPVIGTVQQGDAIAAADLPKHDIEAPDDLVSRLWRWANDIWLSFQISRMHVNLNAKCPACGHYNGRIEFSKQRKQLLHFCLTCRANWAEEPIVDGLEWL